MFSNILSLNAQGQAAPGAPVVAKLQPSQQLKTAQSNWPAAPRAKSGRRRPHSFPSRISQQAMHVLHRLIVLIIATTGCINSGSSSDQPEFVWGVQGIDKGELQ